jgi:hypothetical protein
VPDVSPPNPQSDTNVCLRPRLCKNVETDFSVDKVQQELAIKHTIVARNRIASGLFLCGVWCCPKMTKFHRVFTQPRPEADITNYGAALIIELILEH